MKKAGCIVVDANTVYGARLRHDKGQAIMECSYTIAITDSISDAITTMIEWLYEPTIAFGIVSTQAASTYVVQLEDGADNTSIRSFIYSPQCQELLGEHASDAIDYMTRTIDGHPYLYLVTLPHDTLQTITTPFTSITHKLEVVDYWPYALQGNHQEKQESSIAIIEANNTITGYLWWHEFLLAQAELEKDESPKGFINRLLAIDTEGRILNPSFYVSVKEKKESWHKALTNFNSIELKDLVLDSDTQQEFSNTAPWQAIVGMAYRLLRMN